MKLARIEDIRNAMLTIGTPELETPVTKELCRQVLNHCHGLLNGTNLGRHSLEEDEVHWLLIALAAVGEVYEGIDPDYAERLKQILIDRPDYSH